MLTPGGVAEQYMSLPEGVGGGESATLCQEGCGGLTFSHSEGCIEKEIEAPFLIRCVCRWRRGEEEK